MTDKIDELTLDEYKAAYGISVYNKGEALEVAEREIKQLLQERDELREAAKMATCFKPREGANVITLDAWHALHDALKKGGEG